jgi:hypothetical protein
MQRSEDFSLRQLWRLTRIFWMIKRQPGETEADGSSAQADYVYEQKASYKIVDKSWPDFLAENTEVTR